MGSVRLFVYGSLKRGARHHEELRGAAFLGEACTEPGYVLLPLGEYLALARGGAEPVTGELFEISEALLPALDAFEGEAYEREEILLNLPAESAEKCLALAYFKRTR